MINSDKWSDELPVVVINSDYIMVINGLIHAVTIILIESD